MPFNVTMALAADTAFNHQQPIKESIKEGAGSVHPFLFYHSSVAQNNQPAINI